MPIQTIKTLSMPPEVLEQGEALARKYTGGNFSKLVRLLIEERVAFQGEAWAKRMAQIATEIKERAEE